MSRMFGERINEFVLSTDIMDQETFFDLLKLIQEYVNEHLDVVYFSVLDETVVNNQPGLRTLWSSRDQCPSYTVDKEIGYSSHSALTFGENTPIWVVSTSMTSLRDANDLKDMWSGVENLPAYSTQNDTAIRTSVMHPLTREGRPIGVVEFAAERYIEPTSASLVEARTLATLISRAYQMYDVRRAQRENTKRALQMMAESLHTGSWTRLALPQLFVAYSGLERLDENLSAEHQAVIGTIREIVEEFSKRITCIYWEDVTEAGNITSQVIRDISNSDFGLCYFSEPAPDGTFHDNPNVLFEAGMMQALSSSPNGLLRAWIPIREKDSPTIPFDIASERILTIDRTDGKLDNAAFSKSLRDRMTGLLASLDTNG